MQNKITIKDDFLSRYDSDKIKVISNYEVSEKDYDRIHDLNKVLILILLMNFLYFLYLLLLIFVVLHHSHFLIMIVFLKLKMELYLRLIDFMRV